MPIFDFQCPDGHVHERFIKARSLLDGVTLHCPDCSQPTHRLVSMPARTPGRWGESTGKFDQALGVHVRDSMHKDRILKARGLTTLSNVGGRAAIDTAVHTALEEKKAHEKQVAVFDDTLKRTGDTAAAVCAATPSAYT